MTGHRRRTARVIGAREAQAIAANLGRDTRNTRRRRGLTQAALASRIDLSQSEVSRLERGRGAGVSIETWVAIGMALERPIAIGFSRDVVEPLNDAGHLAAQELLMRLATSGSWAARFEVGTGTDRSGLSTDVVLRRGAEIVLVEIWNRVDDLGAAARASDRKLVATPGGRSFWLLVDTAANRRIVRRYPVILRARFPGASTAWVRALSAGDPPPIDPGLAWIDVRAGRITPMRLSSAAPRRSR